MPAAGGPPRRLLEAGNPVWIDDATLLVSVERERHDAARGRRRSPTRGRAGSPRHGATAATSGRRRLARRHRGRLRLHAARRPQPLRDPRRRRSPRGAVHAAHRHAADAGPRARVVAGRRDARLRVRALGRWALHLVGRDGDRRAAADGRRRRLRRARLAPRRRPHRRDARRAQPLRPRARRRRHRRRARARRRAASGAPRSGPRPATWSRPTRTTRRRPSCAVVAPRRRDRATLLAPAPLAVRRAPHVAPEEVTFRSRDGLEIPALPVPPARPRRPTGPSPAVVYPHGGPTDAYGDDWDGHAQYFVDKGYAWLALNFRGSTGYGRDFERAQPRRLGRRGHVGLPRRRRLPAHARLGRRRPARDLRRQLRLLHGAARRSPTTPSTASAARSPSTATATSSRRGRRATARASRTSSG